MVKGQWTEVKVLSYSFIDNNQQFNCLFGDSEEAPQTVVVLTPTVWDKWPTVADCKLRLDEILG